MGDIDKDEDGYGNLLFEMEKRKVSRTDLENTLGIKRVALSRKLHCQRGARFSLEQALIIHEKFFPDIPVEELFKR